MDHQIDVLGDECEQQEIEFKAGIISARGLQKTKRELAMWTEKKETLQKSTDLDLALLAREDEKARNSIQMLKTDLQRVKNRIGTLTVVSPAYGQITEYNASVGETKNIGSRIAQLDSMDTLKLKANMDEYYLPRITAGNKGSFTYETSEGQKASCIVTISWISPDVKNNSFEVEFRFDSAPPNVRFGQRFAVRVELGKKQDAVLLEQGQFYQTTGGSWVYVVDPSGRTATRRNIVIGRSNPDYLEVLKGLSPDERVVVSEYSGFNGVDRINLK
jgi:HlyD family secretion protein